MALSHSMEWGAIIAALALVWAVFTHFYQPRRGEVTAIVERHINLRVCNNTPGVIVIDRLEYKPPALQKPFLDTNWHNVPIPPGGYVLRPFNVKGANLLHFEPSVHGHGATRRVRVRITRQTGN